MTRKKSQIVPSFFTDSSGSVLNFFSIMMFVLGQRMDKAQMHK